MEGVEDRAKEQVAEATERARRAELEVEDMHASLGEVRAEALGHRRLAEEREQRAAALDRELESEREQLRALRAELQQAREKAAERETVRCGVSPSPLSSASWC